MYYSITNNSVYLKSSIQIEIFFTFSFFFAIHNLIYIQKVNTITNNGGWDIRGNTLVASLDCGNGWWNICNNCLGQETEQYEVCFPECNCKYICISAKTTLIAPET